MFDGCFLFNSDVSQWNVSRALNDNSQGMFHDCPMFDRVLVLGWPLTDVLRGRLFLPYDVDDNDVDDNDVNDDDDDD
jgi:hypothetical protein